MNDNCDTILIADSSLELSQIQKYLNDKSVNIIENQQKSLKIIKNDQKTSKNTKN